MIPLQTASPHPVTHLRFSPDGALLAVAQPYHGVTVLERATGKTVATCPMPRRGTLTGLTFCDGGKHIAAAGAKGLEVFDTTSGRAVVRDHRIACKKLRLAERDGAVVGFGIDVCGFVWQPELPATTRIAFDPRMNRVEWPLTPSPDGRFALEQVYCAVKLHHIRTRRHVAEVNLAGAPADIGVACEFCPLSRRFALNDGCTLDVFDFVPPEDADESEVESASGLPVAPMPHVSLEPTFSLAPDRPAETGGWSPPFALTADGRGLLVKRPRNRIQLWDAPTATLLHEWSWRFEWVTCVAASADNLTAVAGGKHGRVLLWDLE